MYHSKLCKPKVADVKEWVFYPELSNDEAEVCSADIDDFFIRVKTLSGKTKYFYGETAWQDSRRCADDQYNPHISR